MRTREREGRRRAVFSSGVSGIECRLLLLDWWRWCVGDAGTDRLDAWEGGMVS